MTKTTPFKYVSLFSGTGGFEQALNKLDGTCVLASEIDKFANQAYEVLYGHKTVGDITKVQAEDVPDHDVLVGGFPCFAAGTLITTKEGVKPIEDVRKGDQVLTHSNTFKPVVIPMIKRKKGVYNVKIQGSPINQVTGEHPYYVREMKRVWDSKNRTNKRVWGEPKWKLAKDLEPTTDFVGFSENTLSENPRNITKEEAWLIGRYVADGYLRINERSGRKEQFNNQVIFCIGKDKLNGFKNNVKDYYVGYSEERTVYKGRIINERLTKLCLEAGRGSGNKKIPGYILNLPKDILEKFLSGYISGDGSVNDGKYRATSVSKKLIYGIGQVVQKLYRTPYTVVFTKRPKKTVIEGRTVNQRDTWTIEFCKKERKQNNAIYINGMLWNPVRSVIYDESFDGNVYNFEVEGDNSYVANNTTVHNCQAFSLAGNRGGFNDARGTLFFEVARIASQKQPNVLLLENVKGLVGHDKGRTLDTIVKTLNDIGYRVDFNVLNSKYFGVPQNRERIFIVGIREDLIENEPWVDVKGATVVPKGKRRISGYDDVKTFNFDWPEQAEVSTRLRDVLETEVDERYYLSEEKTAKLVAQLNEGAGLGKDGKLGTLVNGSNISPNIDANYLKGIGPSDVAKNRNRRPMVSEPKMVGHIDLKGHDAIKRVYSAEGVSPTLTTMTGGHRQPKIAQQETRPVLTPDRINKQQNGRRFKGDGEESFTLTAQDIHGVAEGLPSRYRIRKLTPLECWRLQNFPDEAHEAVKQSGISDSQRYKMAGNAVTVSVIKALGEKIIPYLPAEK